MIIKFDAKFSELQIDKFIDEIYNLINSNKVDKIYFDLTEIEWISNQGLLLFTGILKYFIEKEISFEVVFIEKGVSTAQVPERVAKQIIQIWEIWGIYKIIPNYEYKKYLGIDLETINSLKKINDINFTRPDIFGSFGITPFICLDYIKDYDDSIVEKKLNDYHKLNDALIQIVEEKKCSHPFINNLFGEIISKEVYENFLDHTDETFFQTANNFAFFSLTLKGDINKERISSKKIQELLEDNFVTEELPESKSFFLNKAEKKFKNLAYISYSFLDFGMGIPNSLKKEFLKLNPIDTSDSEIIKFAFKHNSSRHPIQNISESEYLSQFIPRGLFDVLCIIQRYHGMLIVRSGYGKVMFNFSETQNIEEAYTTFGDLEMFFPGTFITIYLPALANIPFDYSTIKPAFTIPNNDINKTRFLSLVDIFTESKKYPKEDKYEYFFKRIQSLLNNTSNSLTFLDFKFIEEKRLIKKLIFYLLSSYDINSNNNVVILNPPKKNILEELNYEILNLSKNTIDYKIHPLPFIFYDSETDDIEIFWLGIYDEDDKLKLSELLFDEFSLVKSDFNFPDSLTGHLNSFDDFGNLLSNFPNRELIKMTCLYGELAFKVFEVKELIDTKDCFTKKEGYLYFCNGNYYQKEFIELTKLLNNSLHCEIIASSLFSLIENNLAKLNKVNTLIKYITITSSSQRVADSLVNQKLINEDDIIFLENYHSIELIEKLGVDIHKYEYVLICDVLATGNMVVRINNILKEHKCNLIFPAVIVETIDILYRESLDFIKEFKGRIVSLYSYPIKKYEISDKEIFKSVVEEKVIRINSFTNIPISLSVNETNFENTLLTDTEFLSVINYNHIKIGFLEFNNIIHPYFFDTEHIISEAWELIFKKAFSKGIISYDVKKLKIFYPKKSDIKYLNFEEFKDKILKNHSVEHYFLDRFITSEGWSFPHTSNYLMDVVKDSSLLILDDGSCSGDSLTQMINEVAFYKPKQINVISLIGRVTEHKREFLTTLSELTKYKSSIEVKVYFISHWHIPTYYLNENPNIKERNWLNNIINLNNIPLRIRNIAIKVKNELQPASDKERCDYAFLPKEKSSGLPPKKDFIRVRNEIGKVVGYRFYVESFDYFNHYISLFLKSDVVSKKERVKETELLCAVISYEPYLFRKLEHIVPDVTEKIKLFVKTIFFGNPSMDFKKIDISKLTYQWNKRDFLHLYFTIFKEFELVQILKNDFLLKLINFQGENGDSIYYILYKLLSYYPLSIEDLKHKDSTTVQRIIDVIIARGQISEKSKRELKLFRSFTNTLPHQGDFYSYLNVIRENFRKNKDGIYHKNSAVSNMDSMLVSIDVLKDNIDGEVLSQFYNSWEVISEFIEPILAFSKSFPTFFVNNLFILESDKRTALRSVHGRLNKIIRHINSQSDFDEIEELLLIIQNKLLTSSTELYDVFSNVQTHNLFLVIKDYIGSFIEVKELERIGSILSDDIIIDFPEFYLKNLVFEEISKNLRYAKLDKDTKLKLEVHIERTFVVLEISNEILVNNSNGGGNGINIFEKANLFPYDIFKYSSSTNENYFNQKIKLKRTLI